MSQCGENDAQATKTFMHGRTTQLRDGRTIGYVEYGKPNGRPLFYFHGHPGSRFEVRFLQEQAEENGVRLVGVDRPGLGLSSYKAGRSILDWPDDVSELADFLQIKFFSVVGFSGGGPYALACAFRIPSRLIACGIVSGVGQTGFFLSFLSTWLPWLVLPMTRRYFISEERAVRTLRKLSRRWVEPDRMALSCQGDAKLWPRLL
jgi:pimeloyl-ACP methyl ester carboxylesterase